MKDCYRTTRKKTSRLSEHFQRLKAGKPGKPGMGIALDLDVGVEDAPEMSNAELLVKSLTRVAVVVVEETLK